MYNTPLYDNITAYIEDTITTNRLSLEEIATLMGELEHYASGCKHDVVNRLSGEEE